MNLRELREQRLLSQRELAEQAGVSITTIIHMEQGRVRPRPATLRRLAEALGVDGSEIAAALRETLASRRSA